MNANTTESRACSPVAFTGAPDNSQRADLIRHLTAGVAGTLANAPHMAGDIGKGIVTLVDTVLKPASQLRSDVLSSEPLSKNLLPDAMRDVCRALREDAGYAWSWHCNVTMSNFDAGAPHTVASEGSARFLQQLAGVDIRQHPHFAESQASWAAGETGPFGGSELLKQARGLLSAVERLPAGDHNSKLSSLLGDVAFGLQQLQSTGDHFWPKFVGQNAAV